MEILIAVIVAALLVAGIVGLSRGPRRTEPQDRRPRPGGGGPGDTRI